MLARLTRNWKTTLAALLVLLFTFGPQYLWPNHSDFWTALRAVAVALGLLSARDSGTGSDAPNGPIANNLVTASAPVPIDPEKPAPIARVTGSGVVQ